MAASILASALTGREDWKLAVPVLEDIVLRQPNNHPMAINLALGWFRTGRQEDAIQLAEVIRKRDPRNGTLLKMLSVFYKEQGKIGLANARASEFNALADSLGESAIPILPEPGEKP
jgi:predicted Zn-dependent protease